MAALKRGDRVHAEGKISMLVVRVCLCSSGAENMPIADYVEPAASLENLKASIFGTGSAYTMASGLSNHNLAEPYSLADVVSECSLGAALVLPLLACALEQAVVVCTATDLLQTGCGPADDSNTNNAFNHAHISTLVDQTLVIIFGVDARSYSHTALLLPRAVDPGD